MCLMKTNMLFVIPLSLLVQHAIGCTKITNAPNNVTPTTIAPTTVAPITIAPTTVAPTTVAPTTVALTTVAPTTVAPTTVAPTTVAPTTVAPTTVAPTTVAPTTVAPTTVPPTTVALTTVAPTTVAPTTTSFPCELLCSTDAFDIVANSGVATFSPELESLELASTCVDDSARVTDTLTVECPVNLVLDPPGGGGPTTYIALTNGALLTCQSGSGWVVVEDGLSYAIPGDGELRCQN